MVSQIQAFLIERHPFIQKLERDQQESKLYLIFDLFRWENHLRAFQDRVPDEYPLRGEGLDPLFRNYLTILQCRVTEARSCLYGALSCIGGIFFSAFFQKNFRLHVAGIVCAVVSAFFCLVKRVEHAYDPTFEEDFLRKVELEIYKIPHQLIAGQWPAFNQLVRDNVTQLFALISKIEGPLTATKYGLQALAPGQHLKGKDAFGIIYHIFTDHQMIENWRQVVGWSRIKPPDADPSDKYINNFAQDQFYQEIKEKEELGVADQWRIFRYFDQYNFDNRSQMVVGMVYVLKTVNGLENRAKECNDLGFPVYLNLDRFFALLREKNIVVDEERIEGYFLERNWLEFVLYLANIDLPPIEGQDAAD